VHVQLIPSCRLGKNPVSRRMIPWQKNSPQEGLVGVAGERHSSPFGEVVGEIDEDL
jgi:hypothetical protein